jgi:hypothetical protein
MTPNSLLLGSFMLSGIRKAVLGFLHNQGKPPPRLYEHHLALRRGEAPLLALRVPPLNRGC